MGFNSGLNRFDRVRKRHYGRDGRVVPWQLRRPVAVIGRVLRCARINEIEINLQIHWVIIFGFVCNIVIGMEVPDALF